MADVLNSDALPRELMKANIVPGDPVSWFNLIMLTSQIFCKCSLLLYLIE